MRGLEISIKKVKIMLFSRKDQNATDGYNRKQRETLTADKLQLPRVHTY